MVFGTVQWWLSVRNRDCSAVNFNVFNDWILRRKGRERGEGLYAKRSRIQYRGPAERGDLTITLRQASSSVT